MLGQAISLKVPKVVGFKLLGSLPGNATGTDLVLTITQRLRQHGVVGDFVEFFGPGFCQIKAATCNILHLRHGKLEYRRSSHNRQHVSGDFE